MKIATLILSCALVLLSPWGAGRAETANPSCDPVGNFRFLCGLGNPEDLYAIPGTRWLITTGLKRGDVKGSLYLVDTDAKTWEFFVADMPETVGNTTLSCPALPTPDKFSAHGITIRTGENGRHTAYLINHAENERIEIYDLDATGNRPKLTWRDCIIFPSNSSPNSVAVLPDGGLAVTSFGNPVLKRGVKGGSIYEWHPGLGVRQISGTEMTGPNGIEASPDGKYLYVNVWGEMKFLRVTRGSSPLKIEEFPVDFLPDNVHWAPDGTLLAAGKNGSTIFGMCGPKGCEGFIVVKLDPETMKAREIMRFTSDKEAPFLHISAAYQVGNMYWIGTLNGDRIAYVPISAFE